MAAGLGDLPRFIENDQDPPGEVEYERDVAFPDPDHGPVLFYDPARFPDPADVARLRWGAFIRPPHRDPADWEILPLSPGSLRYGSPFSDGRVEHRFLTRGYVTNREELPTLTGAPLPTTLEQAKASALPRTLVLAAAILDGVRTILGAHSPAWLRAATGEVLAPMLGRRRSTVYDRDRGRTLTRIRVVPLIVYDDLLFGCADFSQPRTVVASGYHNFETTREVGISALHGQQRIQREAMQAAIAIELARMPREILPGVALWACQRVAHCRIAAEEGRWHLSRPRNRALAKRFVRMPLGIAIEHGFSRFTRTTRARRKPANGKAQVLRSQWLSMPNELGEPVVLNAEAAAAKVEVSASEAARKEADAAIVTDIANAYDHANWDLPNVGRLPVSLRRSTELAFLGAWTAPLDDRWDEPRGDLQEVADWLGELRRWGAAVLDESIAASLKRILHGCDWEEYARDFASADGRAAIAYLLRLMPPEFWPAVAAVIGGIAAGFVPIPVFYDDTDFIGPIGAVQGEPELTNPIVTRGPFLAFPQEVAELWAARAAKLGPHGLLVPPLDERS